MGEKKQFRIHCGLRFALFVLLCFWMTGSALAGGPKPLPVYYSGQVKASQIKNDGNFNREVKIDGAYLNLILDTDLVLTRIVPAAGYEDTKLTIMSTGKHSLILDSREKDEWDDKNPPVALQAGSIEIKGVHNLQAMGIWYAIQAKKDIKIYTSTVKAESANVDIGALSGDMWIQDSTIDCSYKSGSNGLAAVYGDLTILDSTVQAFGSSCAVRGMMVNLDNCTISADSKNYGIQSNVDIMIKNCTIQASADGSGEYANWAGICTGNGSLTIESSDVTASGNPGGIYGGIPTGTRIRIESGTVKATGTKSAISSANPLQISEDLTVLEPLGGKAGKTTWDPSLPYGIVTAASKTAAKAVIGPIPAEAKTTITPDTPVKADALEGKILEKKDEKDLEGASFFLLRAKGTAKSKTSIKLSWKKTPGATSYAVYGSKCGKKSYKLLATVKNKTTWTNKKLKKGTYYKYIVVAQKGSTAIGASKAFFVTTKGGAYGNPKGVALSKKSLKLKKGKAKKVKASLKTGGQRVKTWRKISFETSDPQIATVSAKGKVRAVGKGTCCIYAFAQNGVFARMKVTVK